MDVVKGESHHGVIECPRSARFSISPPSVAKIAIYHHLFRKTWSSRVISAATARGFHEGDEVSRLKIIRVTRYFSLDFFAASGHPEPSIVRYRERAAITFRITGIVGTITRAPQE